jgi:hypothetical protein
MGSGLETVTDTGFRADVLRLRRICLEFLAQVSDIDAQVVAALHE